MHNSLENLTLIKKKVNKIILEKHLKTNPNIIVVTKTFPFDNFKSIFDSGHIHFGENKIQEAESKWGNLKNLNKNVKLHMIGKLQSNKAKKAIELFDYIHSLDNERLALKLSKYQNELNKKVNLFIQVNLGQESQKSGIDLKVLNNFYNYCVNDLSLNVIGLMCLPPMESNSIQYFKILKDNSDKLNLKDLSMGMSSDYEDAISSGSTFIRIGSAILGNRNTT